MGEDRLDAAGRWWTWCRLSSTAPERILAPHDPDEVAAVVSDAAAQGTRVKMVGSGHSFTDVALTDGWMLTPTNLTGVRAVDRDAMAVTVLAGTPLHVLNTALADLGLSLHNMGDIDRQTVAGAISTGTHGTGGVRASLAAQVTALELATADGVLRRVSPSDDPPLFEAARLGLGAVGVVTAVTVEVEPAFTLEAVEEPLPWASAVGGFDQIVEENHHVDMYWFPHTDRVFVKRNNRTLDPPRPLPAWREWLEDRFLSNTVFGWVTTAGAVVPPLRPGLNRLSSRAWAGRTYSDRAHRVFTAPRTVVFREMEYAVPREAGMLALTEARRLIERSGWRIGFPVEVRAAPADEVWLSTAYDRDSVYLAFHVDARSDHRAYFAGVEEVMRAHDGRPHWGKLHTRGAADLAPSYPRWGDFAQVRDRVDPDRIFANPYLERVLGP